MSTSPTAAPAAKSTIGLKNLVVAPLTVDTEAGVTYGDLQLVAGAIEATIAPGTADPDIQYADDVEYDVLYPDPEITLTISTADIPLAIQKLLLGNKIDDNGVLIRSVDDNPGYFAVGFKSEKTDHTYRYVWRYKCRPKPITENYGTKQGTTIDRKTSEIEFTAIKRTYDGRYQAIADEGQNEFAGDATFLTSVYSPTFTNT